MLRTTILGSMITLIGISTTQAQVVIETVPVGNPWNPGDTRYPDPPVLSFGGVHYAYNIGKFEVTAGQYTEFLNAVAATDTYNLYNANMVTLEPGSWGYGCNIVQSGLPGSYSYSVALDWADRPVNWVSWVDAARFANWLHNGQPTGTQNLSTTEDGSYYLNGATTDGELSAIVRKPDATWVIPSEDEWYKAAYHKNNGVTGDYYDYPMSSYFGSGWPSNSLIDPDPGNSATFEDMGYTIGSPYYRTEVGDHENSESPYATFDQGGNVWEWNEAIIYYTSGPPGRGFRGGSFYRRYTHLAAFDRFNYWPPSMEFKDTGFRVAEVPPCFSSPPEPDRLDLPDSPISQKVRYLSFTAGDAGHPHAIRVTFVDLPPPYDTWNGVQLWVQEPRSFCENAGVAGPPPCPPPFGGHPFFDSPGAELGCDPWWDDWTQYRIIHVFGEGIIPGGIYDIQVIDSTCSLDVESNYSNALTLTQSDWADLVQDCSTTPCKPPDGSTGIVDVTAILDKWKNLPGNVEKVRADLEGSPAGDHRVPDQAINITDVVYCLGAFLGDTYPGPGFPAPSDPPVCPLHP